MALFNNKYPYTDFHELNLDWMIEAISNVQSSIDMFDETVQELKKELANIQGLYPRVATLESYVATLQIELNTVKIKLAEVDAREKADIIELKKLIDNLAATVNNVTVKFNAIFDYIDVNVDKLNIVIAENYRKLIEAITKVEYNCNEQISQIKDRLDKIDTSVINPWHTTLGRLDQDKNNKFIYSDLADHCPTAKEYAGLGLTASEYSTYKMRAINYAKSGKTLLHLNWVYNPIAGYRQDVSNVLTAIINHFSDTMTADQYSALGLTADDYKALELTALTYYKYK